MYPKQFYALTELQQQNGKCFVLMPFANEFLEVYESIREVIEGYELNFVCLRADDLLGGGYIMDDVLRGIGEAEIVIADLTGRNPNVFYELGIAHIRGTIKKCVNK